MAEQRTLNPCVGGSNPPWPTIADFCYIRIMKYLEQESIRKFVDELVGFRDQHKLSELFSSRVDHLAIKMADSNDYERCVKDILSICSLMTEAQLNNRRIATAKLEKKVNLTGSSQSLSSVEYLEIMEPRPEKVGKDLVGIDHCEIDIESFPQLRKELDIYFASGGR